MNSQQPTFEEFAKPLSNSSETLASGEVKRGEHGRLLPGSKLNPDGPKPGYRQFKTVAMNALQKLKKVRGMEGQVEAIEAMIESMVNKAINGDVRAFQEIRDTVDGRPGQNVNHKGTVKIVYEQVNLSDIKKK